MILDKAQSKFCANQRINSFSSFDVQVIRLKNVPFYRYDIMQKCWYRDPDGRPSFDDIVRDLDAIILTGRNVDSSASHLYLNIHTVMSVSDYRDISA